MSERRELPPGHNDLRYAVVVIPIAVVLGVVGLLSDESSGWRTLTAFGGLLLALGAFWLISGLWKKLS